MRRYRGDPYWVTIEGSAKCDGCGKTLVAGERAFKYKTGHKYGKACGCGDQREREFEAMAQDEDFRMEDFG